ncbi:diguanylate cyclase [Tistrella mobilis]|uniref:diguanylate cyclase n=1 Tax=Tistrella mobilis TaxID=171437 RepID=UPI003557CAB4
MRNIGIRQLALALTVMTVLPLMAVLGWSVITTGRLDQQRVGEQFSVTTHTAAQELRQRIDAARQLIAAMAAGGVPGMNDPDCDARFAQLVHLRPIYNNMFVTDLSGRIVCAARPIPSADGQPASLGARPYFAAGMRATDPLVAGWLPGLANGRPILPVVMPVRDAQGRPVAMVGASIDLLAFVQGIRAELPADTGVTLWSPEGALVTHAGPLPPPDPNGTEPHPPPGAGGALPAFDPDFAIPILSLPAVQDLPERVMMLETVSFGDEALTLGISMDEARLFGPVRALMSSNFVLALWLAAGLVTLSMAVMRMALVRPLGRLSHYAKAMVRGEAPRHVPDVSTIREISDLASTLDALSADLAERETQRNRAEEALQRALAGMERTVAARTAELADAHEAARLRARDLERGRNRERIAGRMTDLIQSCASVDEAMGVLARMMPSLSNGDRGRAFLHRPGQTALEPAALWGEPLLPGHSITEDDCWSLRLGHAHVSRAEGTMPVCRHLDGVPGRHLCVPLIAHGEILGMITLERDGVDDRTDWAEDEIAALDRVALSIANVKLRETLRGMTIRDPLTGLYNRRFADETLAREVAVARRDGRPLAAVMADIDHFKRFNDAHGHEAGDRVLRMTARVMADHFRRSDVVCRYGGEEFLILMPGATAADAAARADAFRRALAGTVEESSGDAALGPVTISLGVAVFPETVTDDGRLIAAADAALYAAKHAGRNRVMLDGQVQPADMLTG